MANKSKGEVLIKIGGMDKKLKFDMNSLAETEGILDKPIQEIVTRIGIREVRALLYTGIQWESKPMSISQIGEILNFKNLQYFVEKISAALELCTGASEKTAEKTETENVTEGN